MTIEKPNTANEGPTKNLTWAEIDKTLPKFYPAGQETATRDVNFINQKFDLNVTYSDIDGIQNRIRVLKHEEVRAIAGTDMEFFKTGQAELMKLEHFIGGLKRALEEEFPGGNILS